MSLQSFALGALLKIETELVKIGDDVKHELTFKDANTGDVLGTTLHEHTSVMSIEEMISHAYNKVSNYVWKTTDNTAFANRLVELARDAGVQVNYAPATGSFTTATGDIVAYQRKIENEVALTTFTVNHVTAVLADGSKTEHALVYSVDTVLADLEHTPEALYDLVLAAFATPAAAPATDVSPTDDSTVAGLTVGAVVDSSAVPAVEPSAPAAPVVDAPVAPVDGVTVETTTGTDSGAAQAVVGEPTPVYNGQTTDTQSPAVTDSTAPVAADVSTDAVAPAAGVSGTGDAASNGDAAGSQTGSLTPSATPLVPTAAEGTAPAANPVAL